MRRLLGVGVGVGAAVAVLCTSGVAGAAAVAAEGPTFEFSPFGDTVLMPGGTWSGLGPTITGGAEPDGTYVYVLSKKPLTDAGWSGGGLPAGITVEPKGGSGCTAKAGVAGVYLCDIKGWGSNPGPVVSAASTAADGTTAYYGLVYVPRGASIDAGIKEAQTAGSKEIGPRRAHAAITVKTKAHVAQNTMTLSTPALPAGGTVQHAVKLHAVDKGELQLYFSPAPGYRGWDLGELKVSFEGSGTAGTAAVECHTGVGEISTSAVVTCKVAKPGDYTITYTLKADASSPAWKVRTDAVYTVYTHGPGNPEKASEFAVTSSTPMTERYRVIGVDEWGDLVDFQGTGKAAAPFRSGSHLGGMDASGDSALARLADLQLRGRAG